LISFGQQDIELDMSNFLGERDGPLVASCMNVVAWPLIALTLSVESSVTM